MLALQIPSDAHRPAWRLPLIGLTVMLAVVLLALLPTAQGMVTIWSRSATFTHAFVVPPIVAWLIWRSRARVQAITPAPAPLALLPMALAGVLWLLGELTNTASASNSWRGSPSTSMKRVRSTPCRSTRAPKAARSPVWAAKTSWVSPAGFCPVAPEGWSATAFPKGTHHLAGSGHRQQTNTGGLVSVGQTSPSRMSMVSPAAWICWPP